jgi:hypothetical protein
VRPLLSLKRLRIAIRRFFQTNTHRHMSSKKPSPLTIRTVCFRTTMRAATFRALIEAAVERAAVLNDSFIVGADPSLFRIMGMAQHGDILMSHCKFADPIGIRLALRYRLGDQAVLDQLVAALGLDIEPAPCMGKGSLMPFEDRSVGHMLLDVADKLPAGRLQVLPTAIESGLDCLWDDEKEIKSELKLLAEIPSLLLHGGVDAVEKMDRVNQLLQTYPPVMAIRYRGQTLPLRHQMHLPSEDGQTVLRLHFARDPYSSGFLIGWVDEYDAA